MITHVVMMKFTDPTDASEAVSRLEKLATSVDQIRSIKVGADVVRSEVSYDLAMITTHESLEDLKGYQTHPDHMEFGGWVRPLLAGRVAVDLED